MRDNQSAVETRLHGREDEQPGQEQHPARRSRLETVFELQAQLHSGQHHLHEIYVVLREIVDKHMARELASLSGEDSLIARFLAKTRKRYFPERPRPYVKSFTYEDWREELDWFYQRVVDEDLLCCLLWTGSLSNDGFGQIRVDGKLRLAHRIAYQMAYGQVPEGKKIIRTCGIRRCVRPGHLKAATPAEMAEAAKIARRRQAGRWHRRRKRLSKQERARIRELYAAGGVSYRELGRTYRVRPNHIRDIVTRNVGA